MDLDTQFKAPPKMNWPAAAIFIAKSAALVGAYIILVIYLGGAIRAA